MVNLSFLKRQKEKKLFFVLDIGTEAVKALIFSTSPAEKADSGEENKGGKISVLGGGLEYFDRFRALESGKFEIEVVKKTILKTIDEAQKESGVNPHTNLCGVGVKTSSVFLGLSCDIFQGRIISQSYRRKEKKTIDEKEEGEIKEAVLREAKKKIAESYALQKGILPQDIQFQELRILETKLDGYRIPSLLGYEGQDVDFRILATFFFSPPVSPFRELIREMGFDILGFLQPVEGITSFLQQYPDALFLDIGGDITQIFWAKNGILEEISEFKIGGKQFSQILSDNLGLSELEARTLKHRHSKRDLTEESRKIMREFLKIPCQIWFRGLKEKLRETGPGVFPSEIFIFGGGALLPEIEEILETGDWEDIYFSQPIQVKLIEPKDLMDIEQKAKNLNSQNIPSLLISYSAK